MVDAAKERRCFLCEHDKGLAPAKKPELKGSWFCRNFVECNYRARLRLGIPKFQAQASRRAEKKKAEETLAASAAAV